MAGPLPDEGGSTPKKVEELMNVRGIGEASFLKLKALVTVTPPRTERAAAQ